MFWGVMGWGGIRRNGDGWGEVRRDEAEWGIMGWGGIRGFLVGERFGIYFLPAEAPDG